MNDLLLKWQPNPELTLTTLFGSLVISALLAFIISLVYKNVHKRSGSDENFSSVLIALSPIITLIMIFIGNNLALSLGMVGSLSLIRFRTAIKEVSDLIFLLWVMAVGIGCGTFNWVYSILGALSIAIIIILVSMFKKDQSKLFGTLLVQVSHQDQLKALEHLKADQLLFVSTGVEAIYKLSLVEFKQIENELQKMSGNWRYIAHKA